MRQTSRGSVRCQRRPCAKFFRPVTLASARSGRRQTAHCSRWALVCGVVIAGLLAPAVHLARSAESHKEGPESWPRWRGAQGDAHVKLDQLADPWPAATLRTTWQAELGAGWSSPAVAQGRVSVTDRVGDDERVLAFDAESGRPLWTKSHAIDFDPHPVGRRHGNGPKSTPVVDEGKVYALGIAGRLQCLRAADGEVVWESNFPAEFGAREKLPSGKAYVNGTENVIVPVGNGEGAPVPLFGYTGSPTVWRDLLITAVGGRRGGTIIAFDKQSGRPRWQALQEQVSYSSPVVAELGGMFQVVVMTGPRIVGLNATDGALLWSHPFQIQYDESISTPAVGQDLVLVTATGRPLTALRIKREGTRFSKEVAWTNEILSSYLSSVVVHGDHVYGMNDGGEFSCLRLSDGKTLWTGGNEGYYSSPIVVGKRLLALNERGRLAVLDTDPQAYRELGTSRLNLGETWTMPAVVGSRLYIRSAHGLACYETKP